MSFISLKLPPGVSSNGTLYQAKNRWYTANLIRFYEKTIRPLGGWEQVYDNSDPTPVAFAFTETTHGKPSAIISWARNDSGAAQMAVGTNLGCHHISQGIMTDITPAGFTTGAVDGVYATGAYNEGGYGLGAYGQGDPTQSILEPAATWSLDTWGDYLAGCFTKDGELWVWAGDTGANLVAMSTNAPSGCDALVVTPERMVVALGADNDPRKLHWCDQEDYDTWTAASDNTAGEWWLAGNGRIQMGLRGRNETLIWTTQDLYAMRYIGGTLIYSVLRLGSGCGVISRHGAAMFAGKAAWMGTKSFYHYDGSIRTIPCSVSDAVFGNMNSEQVSKVWTLHNAAFQELTWFYAGAGSDDCDRYATWNYKENHWTQGLLERACGYEKQAYDFPIMSDGTYIYMHESGSNLDGLVPFLESGPLEVGHGDHLWTILQIIPDESTVSGGPGLGNVSAYIKSRIFPTGDETVSAELTLAAPTSVRITAREIRIRIEQEAEGYWRVGHFRLDGEPSGKR